MQPQSLPAPELRGAALDLEPADRAGALRSGRRLALLGFAVALGVALVARGRVHPDEVFQYLEPAHRLVFGYSEQAWEWRDGVRNWVAPGLIAGLLWPFRTLHLDHPLAMVAAIWVAISAAHAGGVLALHRLVLRRDGPAAARLAAFVHATWGGYALYAARPMADSLCIPPLLASLAWTLRARDEGRLRDGISAGVFAGLAVVARYPSLVFGLPLGISLLAARRWRALTGLALGAAAVFAALGALDWITWGSFLHSMRAYLLFNRPGGPVGTIFGVKPWYWYIGLLAGSAPLILIFHMARGLRRMDLVVGAMLAYAVMIFAHPHREARFLLPLLPLGIAIAAGPAARDLSRWVSARPWLGPAVLGAYLLSSISAATLQKPMGLRRGVFDAEISCGQDPALTGLIVAGQESWNTGGRFYLHRTVPVMTGDIHQLADVLRALGQPVFSHVIVSAGFVPESALRAAGFAPWIYRDDAVVWRRPSR